MRLGVRGKLFFVSLGLILVAVITGSLYLENKLRSQLESRIESELLHQARTAGEILGSTSAVDTIPVADSWADRLGETMAARVTVIAPGGRVLGDSELTPDEVRTVENHGQRTEVLQAKTGEPGLSRRYSTTLDTDMLYLAVPARVGDGRGVVRVARPLTEVDRAIGTIRFFLLVGAALAVGAAVFLSLLASHFYSRALRRLVESARSVAAGHEERRIPVPASDEIGGLIGSINQMSAELRQVVASLASERDRFEAVLEGMADGVLAMDETGRVTHVNRTALKLLDLDRAPIGRTLLETIRIPVLHEVVVKVSPGEPASTEFELPGDPRRRLLASATSQREGGGKVVVLQDVSELRRLETIRQDFVANVSHELRTPVSVIRANAETLLNGALDEPERAREFLEALQRNAERLSLLIADLLDVSLIDSGRYTLDLRPVALAGCVRQVLEATEAAARDKRIEVDGDVAGTLRVRADEKALHQTLLNLVDNALKYTPREGHVQVTAAQSGDRVRIEVRDDGPGIEPRHRERIFERFYRVDTGRSREMGGTGLGLSIVKNLVDSMGGEVGIDPNTPRGSVFWFMLPVA